MKLKANNVTKMAPRDIMDDSVSRRLHVLSISIAKGPKIQRQELEAQACGCEYEVIVHTGFYV